MSNFFYYFSKITIIFSILIIIFVLIIKFNQPKKNNNFDKKNFSLISIKPSRILLPSKKLNNIGIDLNDHWICYYEFDFNKYKIEINKKKIFLEIKNLKTNKTQKQDISFYIPFIENYLDMDINELEKISKFYFSQEINLKDLIKNCKKYN
ncbi:MAG: hypothetical protein N2593_02730 [Patescibacteria group bacterium]|nr:hypothetical protein [Patescibacteria group bacterium]